MHIFRNGWSWWCWPLVSAVLLFSGRAHGSGVDPTKLSLPSGPASIEGLGRSFEPSLSTGTASYGVEIAVPSAVGGLAPRLSLDYDSGGGVSELGMGWRISGIPAIRRRLTDGLPRFDKSDAFEVAGLGAASELLEVEPGVLRPAIESGAFVRVSRSEEGERWEARVKSGRMFRFGGEDYTEAEDGNVVTYLLREELDLHGHRIVYEWDTREGHALLERVVWNDFSDEVRQELVLTYEARPDVHELFSSGIRQVISKRLASIEVMLGGALVRRYSLSYRARPHSRLERVTLVGMDGETALPTLSFEYTEPSFAAQGQVIEMENPPGRSPGEADVELADLDGDSLPDLLVAQAGNFWTYINQDGQSWDEQESWEAPPSISLSTEGAQLADVNGDGAIDLLVTGGVEEARYFSGESAAQFGWAVPMQGAHNLGFEDPDVCLADFDGDRRVDAGITTEAGLAIAYNLGGGALEAPVQWAEPEQLGVIDERQELRFSDKHVSLCDVNGDRMQDFCYLRSESLVYWLGRGRGRFEAARRAEGVPDFEDDEPYRLIDLNGDGWIDLVHVGVGRVFYALAEGAGVFGEVQTIEDTPESGLEGTVEFADMNGSGTTDIVWVDVSNGPEQAWQYLELFPDGRGGLLQRIDNGLGKVVTIEYESAATFAARVRFHEPWSTRLNVAMPVVSRVTVDSSLGDPLLVTEYAYRDGTWDPKERTFAGFASGITEALGDEFTSTLVSESWFEVGLEHRALRGAVLASEARDDEGGVFSRTVNEYRPVALEEALDGRRVEYGYKTGERIEVVELGDEEEARTTLTEWKQDQWGNVTEERRWGEVSGEDYRIGDDEAITRRTYAINERDWLLGFAASEELLDAEGNRLGLERNYYDGEAFEGLELGEVVRGDLSRSETWVGPGEADFELVSASRFDEHGNVLEARDALGGGRSFVWDDASHTLVTEERVFTGERELMQRAEYDPVLGTMVAFWDFNGAVTRFEHDALGRLTALAKPGDTLGLPTVSYVYALGNPLSVIRTEKRVSSGEPETERSYALHDGFGRRRAGILMAEDERWVLGAVSLLDARGNTRKTLRPRFVEQPRLEPKVLLEEAEGEASFRDATGRTVRTRSVMGRQTRTEYLPFLTRSWDAAQNDPDSPYSHVPTETMTDGLGRTIAVVRWDEGEAITTRARYSAAGALVELVDPEGNVARYGYDGRGRRVSVDDPDAGEHRFIFDAASNLIEHLHPDGTSWYFEHDLVGRVLSEDWNGDAKPDVTRRYDEDDNGLGKVTSVDDAVGSLEVEYDERGRIVERTRVIEGERYASRYWYDAQDREVLHGFADGSTLRTHYGPRGLIERYGEELLALTYDADGKETARHYTTGIEERFAYDEDQRLTEHRALAEDGAVLQHLTWQYDGVDNVLEVTDRRNGVDRDRARSLTAEYDDLYRLRRVSGGWGDTSYSYSPSGLMRMKQSDDADEDVGELDHLDAAGPHALTGFAGRTLEYDWRGRLMDDGLRRYQWDAADRLREVSHESGAEVHNVFDGDGERRVRREVSADGHEKTTIFLDDWSEVQDGKLMRYLVHNGQRVVRLGDQDGAPDESTVAGGGDSAKDGRGWIEVLGMLTATTVLAIVLLLALAASAWRRRPALAVGTLAVAALGLVSCEHQSREVVPLSGSIVTLSEADTVLFSDGATGTLSEEVSAEGQPTGSFGAHAYGGTRFDTSCEDRKFAGTPRDGGVGVDMMGARAYVPELGVFASVDPLRLSAPERLVTAHPSASAYAYANNNPLVQVDREGEFAWVAGAAVLLGVIVTSQYANAPESAEAPTYHKGWGEQALDALHNAAQIYGAARLVGALPGLARTVAAGEVGTALQTTSTVVKAGAAAEMARQAADAVDKTGTARKVVETASALSMKSVKAPKPPPRAKPEPLKEYFKTLKAGDGAGGRAARGPGPTVDTATGQTVGRFIVDPKGNTMIEPVGGRTVPAGRGGVDTHTLYPNGSNYQRLNPQGHPGNPTPHGHGHLPGTGSGMKGQGPSIDQQGNVVPWNSAAAHWPIK